MTTPRPSEVDRIRKVYRERDRATARHPAIQEAYRRLNAARLARMERLFDDLLPAGSRRLLDVGCGGGYDLGHWLRAGWPADQLAGVDLSADRVEVARLACPGVDVRLSDGQTLAFDHGTFDLVTAVTVFSSILDPGLRATLFREMERVVRPGGVIVVYDFVIRKPTNPDVRGVGPATLAGIAGRPPDGSVRLTPLLQLVAAGALLGPRFASLAMRLAPRTHRLSYWIVDRPAASARTAARREVIARRS